MRTVVYFNRTTRESFACSPDAEPFLLAELFDRERRNKKDFDRAVTTGFARIRPLPSTLDVSTFDDPSVLT
jgi:hypothetical protein